MYKLIVNKIRCKFCGDIIESRGVHDFVRCRCGKCSTDGGREYAQRSFFTDNPEDTYEDMSVYVNTETNEIVPAADANKEDIPLKPIRVEIKKVEVKEDAVWEPWGDTKEPEKAKDGSVRYPHAGAVEMTDILADNSKEPEAKAEEEKIHYGLEDIPAAKLKDSATPVEPIIRTTSSSGKKFNNKK